MTAPGCLVAPMLGGGLPLIICDAADFDGTNDYATRGADLTGGADSKLFTFVAWVKSDAITGADTVFANATTLGGATSRFSVKIDDTALPPTTSALKIIGVSSGGSTVLDAQTTNLTSFESEWVCILVSLDLSDTGKRHLYLADTDSAIWNTYTNTAIDFTAADWSVGALSDGSGKFNGGIAELLFWPGVYVDFSQEVKRRMFVSASGKPVNPTSANGAIESLGAPSVYFHLDDAETANNFVANDDGGATGGAFTVTGALSTYASSPSD